MGGQRTQIFSNKKLVSSLTSAWFHSLSFQLRTCMLSLNFLVLIITWLLLYFLLLVSLMGDLNCIVEWDLTLVVGCVASFYSAKQKDIYIYIYLCISTYSVVLQKIVQIHSGLFFLKIQTRDVPLKSIPIHILIPQTSLGFCFGH